MCGICGIGAPENKPAPSAHLLDRMCQVISHRGPDDQGTLVQDGIAIGMRRLSIIDVGGGHQPIHNEDETIWIVFNGEIYNYPELRDNLAARGHHYYTRSDTEMIVHAYEEWGERCVEYLNGMFAFAIWDYRKRVIFLARDRVGIKPLYYSVLKGRLLFASEIKALLVDEEIKREIDLVALRDYLKLEYVPGPRSIIKNIAKLPPGHTLTWDQETGRYRISQYWDVDLTPSEQPAPPKSIDEHAAELRAVLKESVRKELVSDVPLGVFLSGGVDSSAVAAMMAQLTPGNVNSFSIGFTDPSFDESNFARQVAQHLGTNHQELILEPHMLSDLVPKITALLDEPLGDASIIPTYLLSEFTRRHVTVALGGDGGDELFAGYPTLQAHRLAGYYEKLPDFIRRSLVPPMVNRLPVSLNNISFDFKAKRFVSGAGFPLGERHSRWLGSFTSEELSSLFTRDVREQLQQIDAPDPIATHLQGLPLRNPLNKILYLDMKLYLENDILVKADRASMMASLELRVPLLNVDFVEYVTALPLNLKLQRLHTKHLFKYALRDLLPENILARKKKGFGIPVAKWLRGPLKEQILDEFAPAKIKREGLFDYTMIERLLHEHFSGRKDNRKQLWTLFVFERWYDTYITSTARSSVFTDKLVRENLIET